VPSSAYFDAGGSGTASERATEPGQRRMRDAFEGLMSA
jgi:hypothetical protein